MSHYLYLSLVHFAHLPLKVALFPFVLLNHIYQCFQISLCFSFSYHSYNSYILPYRHDVHIWTTVYYCPPFQWCSPMKKKQNCQMNFFSVNLCIACSLKKNIFFYWSKTCLYRIRPCDQANSSRCHAATEVLWRSVPGVLCFMYYSHSQPFLSSFVSVLRQTFMDQSALTPLLPQWLIHYSGKLNYLQ